VVIMPSFLAEFREMWAGKNWRFGETRAGHARVHEVFDAKEFLPRPPGGMEGGDEIVVLEKAEAIEEEETARAISRRHGDGGAGGGSEIEKQGFSCAASRTNVGLATA